MTQVNLDTLTKTEAMNYVKIVAMELIEQERFGAFQQKCSPNLLNKINTELLKNFLFSE